MVVTTKFDLSFHINWNWISRHSYFLENQYDNYAEKGGKIADRNAPLYASCIKLYVESDAADGTMLKRSTC